MSAARRLSAPVLTALLLVPGWCWVALQEWRILRGGVPLDPAQLADAEEIGVQQPARVRLLRVPTGPWPLRNTAGVTARYGIFIRAQYWNDRALVAHELAHTAQYERAGGVARFLWAYFRECFAVGYPLGRLEVEATETAQKLCE